jgi:hypothetical protein
MAELPSGFVLAGDETLVMNIEADWMLPIYNPLACIIWTIMKFILMILGVRKKGFLIITDKRVVEVWEYIICWCFIKGQHISYVKPGSVKEIGLERRSILWCCWTVYCLYYGALTGHSTLIRMKGADESTALKAAEAFYSAIEHANE